MRRVQVWAIRNRADAGAKARPWQVRWRIDGQHYARSFATRRQADAFRSELVTASRDVRAQWDDATGEPGPAGGSTLTVAEWGRKFLADEKPGWAPRTYRTHVEAQVRWVVATLHPRGLPLTVEMRKALPGWLRGENDNRALTAHLRRFSPRLSTMSKVAVTDAWRRLAVLGNGKQAAASTVSKWRRSVRTSWTEAERLDLAPPGLWPPPPRRTKKVIAAARKAGVAKVKRSSVPDVDGALAAIKAMRSHQPASHGYQVCSAIVYLAGLRPSEVLALEASDFELPESGWGSVSVTRAIQGHGAELDEDDQQIGLTKTATERVVQIPPLLVEIVREYLDGRRTGPLIRTRNGNVPNPSNWQRCWERARETVPGGAQWRIYDLRHACAHELLEAGVPIGEAAYRMGHTPETLVTCYIGRQAGDQERGNRLMDELGRWSLSWSELTDDETTA